MFKAVNEAGKGAIVFINQENASANLLGRLSELKNIQKDGVMKAPNIVMDSKDFGIGAQILHDLRISKVKLMTNSEGLKRIGIVGYGLEIVERVGY
jgi:3,4-dihydroxy 2-butanone 4-phosphate synthase/GTP cyclohydrolase II